MQLFSIAILFLSIFVPIYECAVGYALNATHPDYPGKCYVAIDDHEPLIITPGNNKKHPTSCVLYSCSTDFNLGFASCGVVIPPPHCRLIDGDSSKPYPECCYEVIC